MVRPEYLWTKIYPEHAKEYVKDLEYFSITIGWSEEKKQHHADIRISNHALYPENWPECSVCKEEPMIKTMAAYYEKKGKVEVAVRFFCGNPPGFLE